jgi:hypothetical protein
MNKEIEEMMLTVPQKIVAYDMNPKGQHLYGEQRQEIAEAIYNAGYRKIDENCAVITKAELKDYKRQAVKKFADELKANCSEYLYYKNFDGKNNFDIHIEKISRMIDELLKEYEK